MKDYDPVLHICVADIYNFTNEIENILNSINTNDEVSVIEARSKTIQICRYLKWIDGKMHDILFPDCEGEKNE